MSRGCALRRTVSGWLIVQPFYKGPLDTYSARAFWITALLFASEHGADWDVGLLAGIAYNWWLVRTRRLADCILAHAVTNGCLACTCSWPASGSTGREPRVRACAGRTDWSKFV